MQETRVRFLGQEDPLEKEMAIHSSTLAWKIPWTRSLIGYSPWGRKESDFTEWLHFHKSENFQGYGYVKQVGHAMPSFVHPLVYNGSCAPMNKTSFINFPVAKTSTPS